jgi:bifunctional DNA-binding transcriptional regulator/antitoxin component of YhaV-PrlF toxin-antitoxin module
MNRRGIITLPAKLRQALGLRAKDHLIAEAVPEGLLLRPAVTLPIEIYSGQRIREFDAAEEKLASDEAAKTPSGRKHRKIRAAR